MDFSLYYPLCYNVVINTHNWQSMLEGALSLSTSPIKVIIERINELSRKQRTIGLEEWELAEQEAMRQEYLSFIRGQVKETLNKVQFTEDPLVQ